MTIFSFPSLRRRRCSSVTTFTTIAIAVLSSSHGRHGAPSVRAFDAAAAKTPRRNAVATSATTTTTTRLDLSSEFAVAQYSSLEADVSSYSSPSSISYASSSTLSSSSSSSTSLRRFRKPPRIVPDDPSLIPTVYGHDHCPECVRVRFAFGLKNVKHKLSILPNDDDATPVSLTGTNILPIAIFPKAKKGTIDDEDDDDASEEEEDWVVLSGAAAIIEYLEGDDRYGPTNLLRPASGRADLREWRTAARPLLRMLTRPRYVATGLLPEFSQLDSRHAYIASRPLPPYDEDPTNRWDRMKILDKLSIYADAMAADPSRNIRDLEKRLAALSDEVLHRRLRWSDDGDGYGRHHHDDLGSGGELSMDDAELFAILRPVTIVRGVTWPADLRRYMDRMSDLVDVALYDCLAV